MARNTMATIIAELRSRCAAGLSDYTIAGVTYHTDDQLQTVADRHRMVIHRERLTQQPIYNNGTALYYDYYWQSGDFFEEADGGTVWRVETSAGSLVGTANYTINYQAKHIRFSADQQGTAYYLSARAYDLDRAAADVWDMKAAQVANRYDVQTDNHKLSLSQLANQYKAQAMAFRKRAKVRSVRMSREDVW